MKITFRHHISRNNLVFQQPPRTSGLQSPLQQLHRSLAFPAPQMRPGDQSPEIISVSVKAVKHPTSHRADWTFLLLKLKTHTFFAQSALESMSLTGIEPVIIALAASYCKQLSHHYAIPVKALGHRVGSLASHTLRTHNYGENHTPPCTIARDYSHSVPVVSPAVQPARHLENRDARPPDSPAAPRSTLVRFSARPSVLSRSDLLKGYEFTSGLCTP